MNYPVWDLELGGGLLIAVVAILHVYVSHFAIGGGLFLVTTEHFAYRRNDQGLVRYLVSHSRFFILVTLVFGALTGVGIWFTIGLVNPAATSALIRIFVWVWAIEWVFFFVEIAAAIVYYRTWNRLPRSTHLAVGWVYFIAAFMSLVFINGIITFMLTPGAWLETGSLWDGFFNPTYWPSLLARTAICIALAGIYALVTATFLAPGDTRRWLVRYAGVWAWVGTLLAVPAMGWYHHRLVPGGGEDLLAGGQPAVAYAARVLTWMGVGLVAALLAPVAFPRRFPRPAAWVLAAAALIAFGAGEWVREAARKPFVIQGYLYSNGLRPDEATSLAGRGGILAHAIWVGDHEAAPEPAAGHDVFRVVCRGCHTLDGYNGLRSRLSGLDEEYLYELIGRLDILRGRMPPFPGTEVERRALATYLMTELEDIAPTDGREVFEKRCGFCHMKTGYRPLFDSLQGYTREDLIDVLPLLGDMTDQMAPWSGTEEEAELLAGFLLSWYPTEAEGTDEEN